MLKKSRYTHLASYRRTFVKNLNLHVRGLLDDIFSSLWFRPALISMLAILLAIIGPYIDQNTTLKFYSIGADNARAVLTSIASSMLTVVTLTFSILMVALTLTSQQFSPRVLRSFTSNRTSQNILGILIGSFLYSLLVLVTVIDTSNTTFVPLLSILIAIGFALVGIGTFIYFIDHIAKSIRVSYIILTINNETMALLNNQTPSQVVGHAKDRPLTDPVMDRRQAFRINAREAGYIQAIDMQMLAELAEKNGYTIQIAGMTGDFVSKTRPLLYVWKQKCKGEKHRVETSDPTEAEEQSANQQVQVDEKLVDKFLQQFDIGVERTMFEDVLFGIRQLVDIALKALSPGINDPTTAMNCLHYLTNILIQATKRPDQQISHYDDDGNLCLIGRTVTFAAMLDQTFHQLRHFGCSDPTFTVQLLSALTNIAEETEDAERLNQLWEHAALISNEAHMHIRQVYDRNCINNYLLQLAELLEKDYEAISLTTEERELFKAA